SYSLTHRDLHSFPTRRSSDLTSPREAATAVTESVSNAPVIIRYGKSLRLAPDTETGRPRGSKRGANTSASAATVRATCGTDGSAARTRAVRSHTAVAQASAPGHGHLTLAQP